MTDARDSLLQARLQDDPLRHVAEIALNNDDIYGDPLLAISDFLAGEFADEQLGADLAAKVWNR